VVEPGEQCEPSLSATCNAQCRIQLFGLGAACSSAGQCQSGNCADGICCDAPCNGVCEQCGIGGQCQQSGDDAACGTVFCPADSECRDFPASLNTNRCAARGRCKSQADCAFTSLTGDACTGGGSCDGEGNCQRPTIPCGTVSCPVNPGTCCWYPTLGIGQCQASNVDTCPVVQGASGADIHCHTSQECGAGSICCDFSNPGGNGIACQTSCNPASVAVANTPICEFANQTASPCPAGTMCLNEDSNRAPPGQGYNRCVGNTSL